MELSQFTDYALRTLMHVGLRPSERTQVRSVALAFGISTNHIVKVVHRLGQLGYLDTRRGRGGGLQLARPPAEIVVGDVVRDTENLALVECRSPRDGGCPIAESCRLATALDRATQAFLEVLDDYTLADLLRPRAKLRRALGIGAGA